MHDQVVSFNILTPKYDSCNELFFSGILFQDTTFLVDRFHWNNHSCNRSYSLSSVNTKDFKKINSQVCEQLFSTLRRITTQVSFMRVENVFYNVRYFLFCLNQQQLKNSKIAEIVI